MNSNSYSATSSAKPLVSVITVTYNAARYLRRTVESIQKQSFTSYEHLFIDGASTDDSLGLIRSLAPQAKLITEADKGIYDAMNKGTNLAQGDWIIYMNAGDAFYDEHSLRDVFAKHIDIEEFDFIYGGIEAEFGDYTIHYQPAELSTIWKGKPFHHQAFFSKRCRALEYPFDLQYRICADHDFAYYHYKQGRRFKYVPEIIAKADFKTSSVGNSFWDCRAETIAITDKHESSLWLRLRLRAQIFRTLLVKWILPSTVVMRIRKLRAASSPS